MGETVKKKLKGYWPSESGGMETQSAEAKMGWDQINIETEETGEKKKKPSPSFFLHLITALQLSIQSLNVK